MGTEQLEVSLNILLPLIHDISCFINVSFFFFPWACAKKNHH